LLKASINIAIKTGVISYKKNKVNKSKERNWTAKKFVNLRFCMVCVCMYGGGGLQQLFGTVMPLSFEIHVLMAILMEAFNNKKILKK
jgi:hypothetical protein